jgi:hypothetical protein
MTVVDQGARAESEEVRKYATVLEWATRAGFIVLTVSFASYLAGWLPDEVAPDLTVELWRQPVGNYLARTGTIPGWHWLTMLDHGDAACLLGIALLCSASVAATVAVAPIYARRRSFLFVAFCVLEAGVLVLAASGVLVKGG